MLVLGWRLLLVLPMHLLLGKVVGRRAHHVIASWTGLRILRRHHAHTLAHRILAVRLAAFEARSRSAMRVVVTDVELPSDALQLHLALPHSLALRADALLEL